MQNVEAWSRCTSCILGNKWSQIAARLPGITDNEIKTFWNSSIKKKMKLMEIDPTTHKPLSARKDLDDGKFTTIHELLSIVNIRFQGIRKYNNLIPSRIPYAQCKY